MSFRRPRGHLRTCSSQARTRSSTAAAARIGGARGARLRARRRERLPRRAHAGDARRPSGTRSARDCAVVDALDPAPVEAHADRVGRDRHLLQRDQPQRRPGHADGRDGRRRLPRRRSCTARAHAASSTWTGRGRLGAGVIALRRRGDPPPGSPRRLQTAFEALQRRAAVLHETHGRPRRHAAHGRHRRDSIPHGFDGPRPARRAPRGPDAAGQLRDARGRRQRRRRSSPQTTRGR